MATANDIITRSFTRIGIRAAEESLTAAEAQDGLELLNDMLSSWEPTLRLGFSPVANLTDEIRIPRYAKRAVIDALAIDLAPEYSRIVSPGLMTAANDAMNSMLAAHLDLSNVDYQSTLPLGTGNDWCWADWLRFFPEKGERNF
jgi:hypothetical protein